MLTQMLEPQVSQPLPAAVHGKALRHTATASSESLQNLTRLCSCHALLTSNPACAHLHACSLVLKAVQNPEYAHMLGDAFAQRRGEAPSNPAHPYAGRESGRAPVAQGNLGTGALCSAGKG